MPVPARRRPGARRSRLLRRAVPLGAIGLVLAGAVAVVAGRSDAERSLVEGYAQAWERQDYVAMWSALPDAGREERDAVAFARAHREALSTATARGLDLGTPREAAGGTWEVPVVATTRVFGAIRGTIELPVEGEGEEAAVAWRPHLVFPGLRPGDRLERTTAMPDRADIAARDGSLLARGTERASTLTGASAIVGTVGPAPAERRDPLRALGVPESSQVGVNGLERIFDDRLIGRPGGELRAGRRVLARALPRKAKRVRTTIAPSVQEAAVLALGGRLGGVVALKPRTGEILGVAGIGFSGLQPPGSTFKIITAAAALEAGVVKTSDRFSPTTAATLSGVELQNANGEVCGGSFATSFAESCNSVFAPLGAKLGASRLVAATERFGFNRPPGIAGAATSSIPPASEIGDDLAVGSTAIGQGRVQATPLQMALVGATIALDGRRPAPTLDGRRIGEPATTTRALSEKTARRVGRLMRAVVKEGTGASAAIPGVAVAGKTGTAELKTTQGCDPEDVVVAEDGTEPCAPGDQTDTTAWFVAYAPAGDPEVAVAVMLVGAGAGGENAAPAARQVLQAALK